MGWLCGPAGCHQAGKTSSRKGRGMEPTRPPPLWVWGGGRLRSPRGGERSPLAHRTTGTAPSQCCNYTRSHSAGQSQQLSTTTTTTPFRASLCEPTLERLPKHAARPRDDVAGCRLCHSRAEQRPLIAFLWGRDSAGSCCCCW